MSKLRFIAELRAFYGTYLGGEELVGEAQHYWEVKMTRPVYGTDVMIGLTTQASPTEIHFTKII